MLRVDVENVLLVKYSAAYFAGRERVATEVH